MKSWYEIYAERMNKKYKQHVKKKYKPFISEITDRVPMHDPILMELGCGAANISRLVDERITFQEPTHILVDLCPKMLSLAIMNMYHTNSVFLCKDIICMNPGQSNLNLIHSHGVLEHFEDEDIRKIITKFRGIPQVHYVPGAKYRTPSRGDERLLTKEQWMNIYPFKEIKTFNQGYDLILIN